LSQRLPLQVTPRAAREIREASSWWDLNRPAAPDAFRDAIAKAFELITTHPNIGSIATNVRLPGVRRVHLSKVRYHLYYRVKGEPGVVEALSLWHTSRYPDPKL